jgi:hypothetical protein
MRKNMKIPRKKEKKEQPIIIPRITRLPAWFEPTKKKLSKRNVSYEKEKCVENMKKTYEWKHYKI